MTAEASRVFVGIPAYNEERAIAKVVLRARKNAEAVMVVDDGSQDDTGSIAQALGATVLKHDRRLGKGAGLRDCFKWARENNATALITIDGDGQHDPSDIPLLVHVLQERRADVVVGSRHQRPDGMSKHRWWGQRTLNRFSNVNVDGRTVDAQSGFRAYSRNAILALVACEFGMGVDSELLMRAKDAGLSIVEAPITVRYEDSKSSSQNPVMHTLDVFFSIVKFASIRHPLLFFGGFSAIGFYVSIMFGYWTLNYYQTYGRVVTNLALICVASGMLAFLSLFTGIILFTVITVIREKT